MAEKIFIQIAAYKDPQLKPTILSAIETAHDPANIYFGICWQDDRASFRSVTRLLSFGNISLTCVDAKDTKSIGWARKRAQTLYNEEDYVLQVDSHMRFASGWDIDCKKMLSQCDEKSILTTYLPAWFNISRDVQELQKPMGMMAGRFHPEWSMLLLCGSEKLHLSPSPVEGAFVSSHFIFAPATYFNEVPIDPQMGFGYEEGVMSVRTFTNGWKIYAPNKIVCRHTWNRQIRKLIWDDFPEEYLKSQNIAWSRYRQICGMDDLEIDFGEYGVGTKRTLQEYEEFSGVDFKSQTTKRITRFSGKDT